MAKNKDLVAMQKSRAVFYKKMGTTTVEGRRNAVAYYAMDLAIAISIGMDTQLHNYEARLNEALATLKQ